MNFKAAGISAFLTPAMSHLNSFLWLETKNVEREWSLIRWPKFFVSGIFIFLLVSILWNHMLSFSGFLDSPKSYESFRGPRNHQTAKLKLKILKSQNYKIDY